MLKLFSIPIWTEPPLFYSLRSDRILESERQMDYWKTKGEYPWHAWKAGHSSTLSGAALMLLALQPSHTYRRTHGWLCISESLKFLSHLFSSHYGRAIWNGSSLWLKQEMKSGFVIRHTAKHKNKLCRSPSVGPFTDNNLLYLPLFFLFMAGCFLKKHWQRCQSFHFGKSFQKWRKLWWFKTFKLFKL